MARGLKVNDWVETLHGNKGFIINNRGQGFWDIQLVGKKTGTIITKRSNQLIALDDKLNEKQLISLNKIYKDMALDTKDWDWLNKLTAKESLH